MRKLYASAAILLASISGSGARLTGGQPQYVRTLGGDHGHEGNLNAVGHLNHILPNRHTDGIFYSVTKDAGAYNVAKPSPYVDVIMHYFDAAARRRLGGEGVADIFEEMHQKYEADTYDPLVECTNKTTGQELELTLVAGTEAENWDCFRLHLDNHVYQSAFPIHVETGTIPEPGMEFFTLAIYRYEAPEEGDHDGHDHGRRLSGEAAPESEYPHLAEQFQIRSSKDNKAVGGPEATTVNDVLLLDPNAVSTTPEKGTAGEAYAGSFVVLLMTLIGIIFAIPAVNKLVMVKDESAAPGAVVKPTDPNMKVVNGGATPEPMSIEPANADEARAPKLHPAVLAYTSAFAAGAILACAFLLVLPEALHMSVQYTKDDPDSEGIETEAWKWGTAILAGMVFPWIVAIFSEQVIGAIVEKMGGEFVEKSRIVSGILVGDFFHNFTDGTFIAGAFLLCDPAFGWTVATSTIIHELAQEIADYFVLTTVCGFSPLKALALNFLSGVSVIFGCMLITESDIDPNSLGYLLAFGGGVYIAIGATECMPRIYENTKGVTMHLVAFLLFTFGAVAIGLVLLDHKHCEVEGVEMPGHEGHNH